MYYWGGGVDNKEHYACVEAEGAWEICASAAQFCCEPKTALKMKVF